MGQADVLAEAVDAVIEPAFGDVTVEEAVAADVAGVDDEPEAQKESSGEGGGYSEHIWAIAGCGCATYADGAARHLAASYFEAG